jgi:hypothetical protein
MATQDTTIRPGARSIGLRTLLALLERNEAYYDMQATEAVYRMDLEINGSQPYRACQERFLKLAGKRDAYRELYAEMNALTAPMEVES